MFKKKFNPYNNLNEAVEDLRLAPQIDLTSGKTSMEEAKDFCKYVLTVIGRLGVTDLSTVDSIKSSALIPEELQKLGCVS